MSISHSPDAFVPDGYGSMVRIDPNAPQFVRKADCDNMIKQFEQELYKVRQNHVDAGQREARWMMIETRLRKTLTDIATITYNHNHDRYWLAKDLLKILDSDPPIVDGFKSEKGLSIDEVNSNAYALNTTKPREPVPG